MATTFSLQEYGITVGEVHHNLPPSSLYEHAIRYEKDASIAENGALVAYSGTKTGRSPKDKRVVRHPNSEKDVWWGHVNIPCEARTFEINRQTKATVRRNMQFMMPPSAMARRPEQMSQLEQSYTEPATAALAKCIAFRLARFSSVAAASIPI